MAKITYIEADGEEHVVDVEPGKDLMHAATAGGVLGIIGDCDGNMLCATCHVYVDPAWEDKVGEKSETEEMMLEEVFDAQPNSRLSCQLTASEELDGLVLRLPERQV